MVDQADRISSRDDTQDIMNATSTQSVAGGGTAIPQSATEVLDLEGLAPVGAEECETEPQINAWLFREDVHPRRVLISDLPELVRHDENFVWVDVSAYMREQLQEVARTLNLDPVGVQMATSQWQRPRIDVFEDHFFVSATVARVDNASYRVQAGELDLFVGQNFLVSTHKLPLPFGERLLTRARRSPGLIQYDSAYMLYIILDELLAYGESLQEHVQDEVEKAEERALTNASDDFLKDLLHLKRYVFALSQLADQHRQPFAAFLRPDFRFVSKDELSVYYRDLDSRLSRLIDTLQATQDSVNGAFDIYVSHVSHRTNQVMKLLTLVSTTLLPIGVIVSFFGTSFKSEGFLYSHGGFTLMIGLCVLVLATVAFTFHKNRWI